MPSRAWALAFVPLAVACSSLDAAREPLNGISERLVPQEEVERDLSLTLRRLATEAFEIGHDPRLEVVLSNRSKTRSYPVVVSGDGSEAGFREPHVFYTVERRSSSSSPWERATEQRVARCGNYDEDWTKDVVSLAPGKEIVLPWFGFPSNWELDGASHARIVAHYAYGEHARDEREAPPELHGMPSTSCLGVFSRVERARACTSGGTRTSRRARATSARLALRGSLHRVQGRICKIRIVIAGDRSKNS